MPTFTTHIRPGRSVAALLLLTIASLLVPLAALVDAGGRACGAPAVGAIRESQEFTPYASRRTSMRELPINPEGRAPGAMPLVGGARMDRLAGMEMRWGVVTATGGSYRYFLDRPVDSAMTPQGFWAAGGVQLDIEPMTEEASFASYLLESFPGRAIPIRIGRYDGALVWADPTENGTRTHRVFWSDGVSNFTLIAVREPHAIVATARAFACGR